MAISAPFGTISEADQAYYGVNDGDGSSSGGTGSGGGDSPSSETDPDSGGTTPGQWGELQQGDSLGSGWVLAYQEQVTGDRTRWFVIRNKGDDLQALNSQGQPYTASETDSLADLPHFDTETDAREAFNRWAVENEQGTQPTPDEANWSDWRKIRQEGPWWVFSRTHLSADRSQFLIAGKKADGSTVYLGPGGSIRETPHIFKSLQTLRQALQAYFQGVQDGKIADSDQPTGDAPSKETVTKAVREAVRTSSNQSVERVVEKFGGRRVVLAAVAVVGIIAYQQTQEAG